MPQCKSCNKKLESRAALQQHMASKHGGGTPARGAIANPQLRKAVKNASEGRSYQPFMNAGEGKINILREEMAARLGTTVTGSSWALRYLHPCDETRAGGERIPDATSAETAAPELRVRTLISPPSGTTEAGTWDVMVYSFPIPELGCLVFRRPANSATWVDMQLITFAALPIVTTAAGDAYPATGNPLQSYTNEYRATYLGITCELNAPKLADQGMYYGAQWADKPEIVKLEDASGVTRSQYRMTGIPEDPDALYSKSSKMNQWLARHGAYMPFRFVDPTSPYQPGGNIPAVWGLTFNGRSGNVIAINDGALADFGPAKKQTWWSDGTLNLTTGCMMFMGIDKSATLSIKVRKGMQCVPSSTSPWGPYMEDSPRNDPDALRKTTDIAQMCQLSYPASYNDLGWLWSKVLQPAIKGLGRVLLPHVNKWVNE